MVMMIFIVEFRLHSLYAEFIGALLITKCKTSPYCHLWEIYKTINLITTLRYNKISLKAQLISKYWIMIAYFLLMILKLCSTVSFKNTTCRNKYQVKIRFYFKIPYQQGNYYCCS